jgi:hydroxymethylglutaryl-CoA lyase
METIRVSRHPGGGVAEITLNRPAAMNSVSTAMAGELTQACVEIAAAPEIRVVVLSAAGERAFCAGADLKERSGMTDADILRQRHAIRATFGALLALPQPAIAAVHGFALGGGCELALSCDLVVADATATFGLPEVTVGLVPGGGGTQLALRRLGPGPAADLVLTGRRVGVDEAERLGLVDRRVAAGQDGQAALELAGQIAANSPVAVRAPSVRYSALVPNLRGALRALDAGFAELEAVVSASETHNRKNVNRSTGQSLDEIAEIISVAHERGATVQVIVSTAWGCPYEGDVPVARTVAVAGRAIADGADSASFGDTTGMATPTRVRALVGAFRSAHPETTLNLHFHNTRGTGLANVLAALELGVSDFDASVGGLGGCPYAPGATGNIATEELVHMVEDMGVSTGIDLEAMIAAAAEAEGIVGRTLPSQVLRAGPRTRTIEP